MSPFLSVRDAALMLAGDNASSDTIETWSALLISQADSLHVVRSVTEGRGTFPGGISYLLLPEEWKIPRFAFNAWCMANGISTVQDEPVACASESSASNAEMGAELQTPLSRQRFQEQEILRVIVELGYDPQAIPKWQAGKRGVKAEVKSKLTGREWQGTVFKLAWERLRASGGIKDAP